MEQPNIEEIVEAHPAGFWRRTFPLIFDHWCLKKSRILYRILYPIYGKRLRINVLMRCREEVVSDSGHAWLTKDGRAMMERSGWHNFAKTKIGDTGKYIYWIQTES